MRFSGATDWAVASVANEFHVNLDDRYCLLGIIAPAAHDLPRANEQPVQSATKPATPGRRPDRKDIPEA